ncbi:hypothetical protein ACIQM4_11525 [Streptomyces sp. NPDC091272]|uniref:hypothetical protein n=1 Tax=Streptomyces sp. NPDC091272 TaxID=3365981 RepID=UPI00383086B6
MNTIKRVFVAGALAGTVLSFTGAAQADGWAVEEAHATGEAHTFDNETAHDVTEAGVVSDALDSLHLQ